MGIDDVTGEIVDASVQVHRRVGPGLLESVYGKLLGVELTRRGLRVERQKLVVFEYDGIVFSEGLRLDMLVEDAVILEATRCCSRSRAARWSAATSTT